MRMRNFTKLLLLFVLCLVGMQGNAQDVTIRANNGSMIASRPVGGDDYDTFFKCGGFATWQHEQLSMVLTASDATTLTNSEQLANPANNLFSEGTMIQVGKGYKTYPICYLSLSLPKGYRFTKYTIKFSKPNQLSKSYSGTTIQFNTANVVSTFGETDKTFDYTNSKDVTRGGAAQTITRTSGSEDDMGNVLYFKLINEPESGDGTRTIINLESAVFEFTSEADYAPLTVPGDVQGVSAIDIPFNTSKVDYGTITNASYGGVQRVSYSSANVKDLKANFTLYEAGSVKDGADFDGTSGKIIEYKQGSISVEDGYYRIGAADAANPGTEEHIYYIETPSYVLLSDNATKNPVGYRIVGATVEYKYGTTNLYGSNSKTYDTFYISITTTGWGGATYYLNSTGGATTTESNKALWFIDEEGYIRTGANGTTYLSNYNSQSGGNGYAGTTQDKASAVKFSISSEGYIYYTENGSNYWLRRTTSWGTTYFRFQNNTGDRLTRTMEGNLTIKGEIIGTATGDYTLKVYDKTGTSAQPVTVNSDNASGTITVAGMNNDALKIGVIGTGLIKGTLTLQALDPYLKSMEVVCTDPQVFVDQANTDPLRITQNFTATDFSVNGGVFYFHLPEECNTHDVAITFEELTNDYLDETYDTGPHPGSTDHNSRINFVKSQHYNAFGASNNNIYNSRTEAASNTLESARIAANNGVGEYVRTKVGTVGTAKFKFNNADELSSQAGILTEYPFTLEKYAAAPNGGGFETMTFTVTDEDQQLTRYVFTTDETRYNIAPTTAVQHRTYAYYQMEVHVQSSTYSPEVTFVKVYDNTVYDNSAEEGGSINQNDAFFGAIVTANDGGKAGYASTASIFEAIDDAIADEDEAEQAAGDSEYVRKAPRTSKQILYLDFSGLAGILQITTQQHQSMEDFAGTNAANCMIFLPKGASAPNNNVAYLNDAGTFQAAHSIVLTDKQPFFTPYDIQIGSENYATYTRMITRPENGVVAKGTLILPFAIDLTDGVHTNADGKCSFSLNTMKDNQDFSQGASTVDHPSATFEVVSGNKSVANTPYVVKVLSCDEDGDNLSFVVKQKAATIVATPKQTSGLGQIFFTNETVSGQYTNKKKVTTPYTCTQQGSFAGVTYDRAVSENVFYFAANMFLNLHTLAKAKGQYLYNYPFRSAYTYPDGGTGNNLLQFFEIDFEGPLGTDAIAEMPQQADLAVSTGKGYISMSSAIDQTVSVRSLNGMTVGELNMRAGDSKSINLPAGIYVVNNVKIIVK